MKDVQRSWEIARDYLLTSANMGLEEFLLTVGYSMWVGS